RRRDYFFDSHPPACVLPVTGRCERPQNDGKSDGDHQKSYRGFDNLAAAPYESSGFSFTARFMFSPDDRRLTGVDLDIANSNCADLEGTLRSRYGEPESEQNTFVHSLFTWRDVTDGNQVSLLRLGTRLAPDYCSLRYRPLLGRDL